MRGMSLFGIASHGKVLGLMHCREWHEKGLDVMYSGRLLNTCSSSVCMSVCVQVEHGQRACHRKPHVLPTSAAG